MYDISLPSLSLSSLGVLYTDSDISAVSVSFMLLAYAYKNDHCNGMTRRVILFAWGVTTTTLRLPSV